MFVGQGTHSKKVLSLLSQNKTLSYFFFDLKREKKALVSTPPNFSFAAI